MSHPAAIMAQPRACLELMGCGMRRPPYFLSWALWLASVRSQARFWDAPCDGSVHSRQLRLPPTSSCAVSGTEALTFLLVLRAQFSLFIVRIIFLLILLFKWLDVHHLRTHLSSGELTHIKYLSRLPQVVGNRPCIWVSVERGVGFTSTEDWIIFLLN